jgi:hypothetical protein
MFQGPNGTVKYVHDDLSFQIPSHLTHVVNLTSHLTLCPTGSLYLILERKTPSEMHETDRRVWVSDGSECEDSCFVACDVVCFGIKVSTFKINVYLFWG